MVVDAHIHLWKYHPVKDAWITDDMAIIQRDFFPQDAQAVFLQNGIDGCVAVQASQTVEENRFLLQLASENPFIKGIVGWTDLASAEIETTLETYKAQPLIKGFRHVAQGEPDGFLLRDEIVNGIRQVGKNGYTYDILIYGHQLADAIQLSEKLPGQPFVLDHCAKPALRENNIAQWKQQIKEIALNPDMYCKVSGLLTEDHWHNCNHKQLTECLDVIFESFGTGRILFGSDWPVILVAGHYNRWKAIIEEYTAQFSSAEQQAVFGGNAIKFYNL